MGILFACPHCGAQTEVESEFVGKSGPCFACGKTIVVEAAARDYRRRSGWPLVGVDARRGVSGG